MTLYSNTLINLFWVKTHLIVYYTRDLKIPSSSHVLSGISCRYRLQDYLHNDDPYTHTFSWTIDNIRYFLAHLWKTTLNILHLYNTLMWIYYVIWYILYIWILEFNIYWVSLYTILALTAQFVNLYIALKAMLCLLIQKYEVRIINISNKNPSHQRH